ncbi:MAG: NAD(P)H-dependent glycerol-3-phosphate dehydrogenase [Rhizobiaceae bacterium]|nr:NAD(P)H-dependent glycerol-3-phosphate dehydrogenase [Rhizobiaceae bacterium]
MSRVAVAGGGAWGTALAITAARAGHSVSLWARDADIVHAIARGENPRYLPGIRFDPGMKATIDPGSALSGASRVLLAVPAQQLRSALAGLRSAVPDDATLILCAKGLESGTGKRLSTVVRDILPANPLAVLSGPSFATDVARGLPTAVVLAAPEASDAAALAAELSSPTFRCYSTDDVVGVELGGALKNVLALAAGAVAGAGLGASAQAAMVTRGFVELRRIATAFGARPGTLMGLSGLGDLSLTCASAQSRNFAYGVVLGRAGPRDGLPLAEGVATCAAAARIARERSVEAPIIVATDLLLRGEMTIRDAVSSLMTRPLRGEDE